MGKLKFALTNIWFWLTMAVGCFFVENIALLTKNPTGGFDYTTFWLFAIAAFTCAIMYIVLERKKNHIGVDKILLPSMVVIFIVLLVTIWMQGTSVFKFTNGQGEIVVSFTTQQKAHYSIFLLFVCIFTYMSTAMMFSNRTSNRSLRWLPFAYILFTYITIGFSIYNEWGEYVAFFKGEVPRAKAFYLNSNTFAIALFIGMLSCMVFNYYKTSTFANVTIIVFGFAQFFTNCATSFLLGLVVVPLYFIANIIHNAKQNYVKTAIYFGIFLAIYITLSSYLLFNGDWLKGVDENLRKFKESLDFETFTHRSYIWIALIEKSIDTPLHAIFGHGFMTGDVQLNAACRAYFSTYEGGSHSGENGFVNILFNYGLTGLFVYTLILGYFVYCLICLMMRKRHYFCFIYGMCFLSLTAYNMMEQNNFFDMGFKETYMTLAFYMPVIHMHKMDVHLEKVNEFRDMKVNTKREYMQIPHLFSLGLLGLTSVSLAGLLITGIHGFKPLFNTLIYVTGGLLIASFILPYLVYLWSVNKGKARAAVHISLNSILIIFVSLIMLIFFKYIYALIAFGALILIEIVVYAIKEKDYFKSYYKMYFLRPLISTVFPSIISIVIALGLSFLFEGKTEYNVLTYIAFMVVALVMYIAALFIVPNKNVKKSFEYMNNILLCRDRTFVRLERRPKICLSKKLAE